MIKFDAECLMCQMGRQVKVARELGDEKALDFAKDLMEMYRNAPEDVSSPLVHRQD